MAHRKILLLIITTGALIRIIHLVSVWNTPVMDVPIIDSEYYHTWARALASDSPGVGGVFFMSPLVPYVLSFFYHIFGPYYPLGIIIQFMIGVCTIYLIYRLAARLFHQKTGLIAAGLAAVYVPFIYYESVLLTAVFILFLNGLVLIWLMEEKKPAWKYGLIGAAIGLSSLARPTILLFGLLLIGYYILSNKYRSFRQSLLILLGILLILGPVAIRNYRLSGEFVLTTAGAGMNFYAGNNPQAEGIYTEAPFIRSAEPQYENEDYRLEASRLAGRELNVSQASRFWLSQGIDYIMEQPWNYLKLLQKKFFLFFHRIEIPNNLSLYAVSDYSVVLRLLPFTFGLLMPLGLAAWIFTYKRRLPGEIHLYGLSYLLITLIFFAGSEYRLPVLLVLIPLAAAAISDIYEHIRHRKWNSVSRFVAIALLLAIPVNIPVAFTSSLASSRMDYFNWGSVLLEQNRPQEAAEMLNRSLFLDPGFAEAHQLLGDAFHMLGLYDEAEREFRLGGLDAGYELRVLDAEKQFEQAAGLAAGGEYEAAWQAYSDGVNSHPRPPAFAYYNMAFLSLQLADTLRAWDEIEIAADLEPEEPRVEYFRGWLQENLGHPEEALQHYLNTLTLNPNLHEARIRAAGIYLDTNQIANAAELIEPLIGVELRNPGLLEEVERIAKAVGYRPVPAKLRKEISNLDQFE